MAPNQSHQQYTTLNKPNNSIPNTKHQPQVSEGQKEKFPIGTLRVAGSKIYRARPRVLRRNKCTHQHPINAMRIYTLPPFKRAHPRQAGYGHSMAPHTLTHKSDFLPISQTEPEVPRRNESTHRQPINTTHIYTPPPFKRTHSRRLGYPRSTWAHPLVQNSNTNMKNPPLLQRTQLAYFRCDFWIQRVERKQKKVNLEFG